MTPCGHNFCGDCIKECLNREHICPCCRNQCEKKGLVRNHHVDQIILILRKEKDIASKAYFDTLLNSQGGGAGGGDGGESGKSNKSGDADSQGEGSVGKNNTLSPIEQVFHKYMKSTVASYQSYYSQLEKKYEKEKRDMQEQLVVHLTDEKMKMEQAARKLRADRESGKVKLSDKEMEKAMEEARKEVEKMVEKCKGDCRVKV